MRVQGCPTQALLCPAPRTAAKASRVGARRTDTTIGRGDAHAGHAKRRVARLDEVGPRQRVQPGATNCTVLGSEQLRGATRVLQCLSRRDATPPSARLATRQAMRAREHFALVCTAAEDGGAYLPVVAQSQARGGAVAQQPGVVWKLLQRADVHAQRVLIASLLKARRSVSQHT